uniref:Natural resistance-associated macrophage protein 7 n=1 Tax=Fagopyrum tataricum TaxID=62330 RepID=A0AA95Z2P0_FAGTA|nr:natural resistance-associated macrophage protein 7 [Fagopyrum tataricum]
MKTTTKEMGSSTDIVIDGKKLGWRNFLAFVGPGFLVSLAYLDPANMEADMNAGAVYKYELLWVTLVGLIFALVIQSLAANLGVCTGKHLSEICRAEYPVFIRYCLWLLAEVAVIAADVPEVIGTAFALNILFNIPVWVGVLLTGFSTLLLLAVQRFGVRKLEALIAALVFVMAGCFFGEMAYAKPPAKELFEGMFIPKLKGKDATASAISVFGALVMPHNLFLHSGLVLSRKVPGSVRSINQACKFFLIESGLALLVAAAINVAIIAVSASVCASNNLSSDDVERCGDLTLNSAAFLLKDVLGRKTGTMLYAIALLASGQSSTITGTYAGQYVMQGFLNLKMKQWKRNLMTRCIAIVPSLIVSLIGGPSAAGRLILIASMILSFDLPFVFIPLLKFSSGSTKMGPHKNSIYVIVFSWVFGVALIAVNLEFLVQWSWDKLHQSTLPRAMNVFLSIIVCALFFIYIVAMIYLAFRKDTIEFFGIDKIHADAQITMEKGVDNSQAVPYREDLADIPLSR